MSGSLLNPEVMQPNIDPYYTTHVVSALSRFGLEEKYFHVLFGVVFSCTRGLKIILKA